MILLRKCIEKGAIRARVALEAFWGGSLIRFGGPKLLILFCGDPDRFLVLYGGQGRSLDTSGSP